MITAGLGGRQLGVTQKHQMLPICFMLPPPTVRSSISAGLSGRVVLPRISETV
jgi:hypothetical protein